MANESLLKSSIGKKFTMALSALFLIVFLLQHFVINTLSVVNPNGFNEVSAFMSYNPLIQYVMQPILLIGVCYHFIMGFVLELQNKKARGPVAYQKYNGAANATWMSRNMVISGLVILVFLLLHLYDFWVPTIVDHYIAPAANGSLKSRFHIRRCFKLCKISNLHCWFRIFVFTLTARFCFGIPIYWCKTQ